VIFMADQSQIDALAATIATLKSTIYSGVLRARINDRDTTFRSLDEMKEALRLAQNELDALTASPTRRRPRQVRFMTSSGFGRG
jgi:hypothetical protein